MSGSASTVTAVVHQQAAHRGAAGALLGPGGQRISYRDLAGRVASVAAELAGAGVRRGDRVLVPAPNTPDAVIAVLGAMCAGVAVPLNPAMTEPELAAVRAKTRPSAVLLPGVDSPMWTSAAAQVAPSDGPPDAAPPGPDDLAVLIATSGSVESPRFVALTHDQWIDGARRIVDHFGIGPADRVLNLMPLFHNHGLNGTVLTTLLSGGQVYCPGATDITRMPLWLAEISPTWATGAPTVHSALLEAAADAPDLALRFVRSASAPLPAALRADLVRTLGAPVVEIWGLTEAGGQVTAPALDEGETGGVGVACHGFEVAVLDEDGRTCPPGTSGEVVVAGGRPSCGYYEDAAATAELFRDGWLRTNDIGVLDDAGRLRVQGRVSDYANRGGEKVWLPQIDTACADHPGVREAMAFAVPHPRLGQDVAAAVVPAPGAEFDPAELRNFLRGRLPAAMIPRRVEVVASLPVGPTGKAVRRLLSESFGASVPAAAPVRRSGRSPIEVVLAALWCEVLGVDSIGDDEDFLAAGGDSILATRLVANVADALGVDLSLATVLGDGNTVAGMARVVAERKAVSPA